MTPTVEYVQGKIGEFNALIFSSSLPPITVKLTKARSFLGKVQYKRRKNILGKVCGGTDFLMRISTTFDLSESEQEDVIIHEMIHCCIACKGIRDTSAHGKVFHRYMDEINLKFGRHITVRHKVAPGMPAPRSETVRPHYICISRLDDDALGVTVCAQSKISELCKSIPKAYRIKQMNWYVSMDPFFNKYPRSRTPKVYKISREEIDEHLSGAQELNWR